MLLRTIIILFLYWYISPTFLQAQDTKVYIFGSLHRAHTTNANYTYQNLYDTIASINPDVIGIEIRAADISRDTSYLKTFYPLEMIQLSINNRTKKIYGFDWLGEITDKELLSSAYFNGLEVKKLQQKLHNDSSMKLSLSLLHTLSKEKK